MRAVAFANASVLAGTSAPSFSIHSFTSASRRSLYAREHRRYGDPSSANAISTSARSDRFGRSSMFSSIRRRCDACSTEGISMCRAISKRFLSSALRFSHSSTTRRRRARAASKASAALCETSLAEICRFAFAVLSALCCSSSAFFARACETSYASASSPVKDSSTIRLCSSSATSRSNSARRSSVKENAKNALRDHSARNAATPFSVPGSQSRGEHSPVASRPASTTHASTLRRISSLLTSKPRTSVSFASRRAASDAALFVKDVSDAAAATAPFSSPSRFHSHFTKCSPRNASSTGTGPVFGVDKGLSDPASPYSSRHTPRDTRNASARSPLTHSEESFSFSFPAFFAPFPPFPPLLFRFSSAGDVDLSDGSGAEGSFSASETETSPNTGDRAESASGTATVKPSARAASVAVAPRSDQRSRQKNQTKRRSSPDAHRRRATRSSNPRTGAFVFGFETVPSTTSFVVRSIGTHRSTSGDAPTSSVGLPTGAFASGDDDKTRSARPETPSKPTPLRLRRTPSPALRV